MQIPNLTSVVTHIQNPNKQLGVLLEEIPSDIGRSVQGYKRGGIIEGAEKLRKEIMAAAVWLYGIPVFKAGGDKLFEQLFKVPMNIDFSNAKDGNDAIGDTLRYIFKNENPKMLDVSELKPEYIEKFIKLKPQNLEEVAKKISTGKKITSVVAVALNCILMGIVIPKFNQYLTRKKVNQQKQKNYSPKFDTMKEFTSKAKSNNGSDIRFTGFFNAIANDIKKYGFAYAVGYNTENNNTFRLISTDIPMIAGRTAVSRNPYDAFENFFMDSAGMYFYNFCSPHVQKGLRKLSGKLFNKNNVGIIPDIKPAVSDYIAALDESKLKDALQKLNGENKNISELFSEDIIKILHNKGTYGKAGKINKFVKNSDIEELDKSVINYMNYIKANLKGADAISSAIKDITKKVNRTNAVFLAAGIIASITGLAYIIPKVTFFITKKLSGSSSFPGVTEYGKNETKNTKNA